MCRKRGRIILIGMTGLELDRSDFYEKERLSFKLAVHMAQVVMIRVMKRMEMIIR